MASKYDKNSNVLMFSATSHPLLEDIQKELENYFDKVMLYRFLSSKNLLHKILKNTPFYIKNLKYVFLFLNFLFENKQYFGFRLRLWYYFNLLYLLFLDKKNNFDIIDSHWVYPAGLIATTYSKYFPKRVIITVHGYDARKEDLENKPQLIKLILNTISKADYVLTAERKLFENLRNLGAKTIVFTNQFVNLKEFDDNSLKNNNKISINKNAFVIGFGPHLKDEYGIKDFVQAVISVKKEIENMFIICLGGGNLIDFVKKTFDQNNIQYLIPGRIPRIEFIEYIKVCDLICIPGYITQGIFALECFACSKPVIGYDNIHEIKIENNLTGKLIKKGNIDSLSKEILSLYNNFDSRITLGKNARKKVEMSYAKKNRINDILKAFCYDKL